jgi:septal ring factor EnvC (AmiA/AmiB activator)
MAFLDAQDGHLVVLPGDSPADSWAGYATLPDSESNPVSMPAVVTFVYRTDVPKAPETVTLAALQQERTSAAALATDLRRLEERLGLVQRELTAAKQDADKTLGDMRALADDLAAVRKFMLQTAQLGWLSHELTLENASGVRKMAATSQELAASSVRLEDSLRQLSESLAGQLKELAARLDAIQGKIQNIK